MKLIEGKKNGILPIFDRDKKMKNLPKMQYHKGYQVVIILFTKTYILYYIILENHRFPMASPYTCKQNDLRLQLPSRYMLIKCTWCA